MLRKALKTLTMIAAAHEQQEPSTKGYAGLHTPLLQNHICTGLPWWYSG